MNDLEKLFLSELTESYDAEQQSCNALGQLEKEIASPELKSTFHQQLEKGRGHINRLEQIFNAFGQPAQRRTSHGVEGIISEAQSVAKDFRGHPTCDAGLLTAAEKMEHYKIASYGSLCSWAQTMNQDRVAGFLDEILKEEQEWEANLGQMARPQEESGTARTVSPGQQGNHKDRMLMFLRQLRMMYDGEHLLVSALAEVGYYADSILLRLAVRQHRKQTENHVKRLEEVFCLLGETIDRRPCDGIEGIIDDAQISVFEFLGNSALDSALIAAAQKAEHYEISAYESLCACAEEFGFGRVLKLLKKNLMEEKSADRKLTFAAEWLRNPSAKRQESEKKPVEMAEFLKLATHAD